MDIQEEKRIRFLDSQGEERFHISTGGIIKMLYGNGDSYYGICHYIDENHMEMDGMIWEIHRFAEKMEKNGIFYEPMEDGG